MNKIFKIIPIFFLLLIVSCDTNEGAVYNGNVNNFTFLSVKGGTAHRLEVVKDGEGILRISLEASVVAPFDRTYGIELVEEEEDVVVANPLTYNLPESVTIPANEFFGEMVITGQDLNLVDTNSKPFSFRIVGLGDKEFMDENKVTVGVMEVCPFAEGVSFEGDYRVNSVVASSYASQIGNAFTENSIVRLSATSQYGRKFSANYYPDFWNVPVDFSFIMVCGELWVNSVDTKLFCTGGSEETSIKILTGNTAGTYDSQDDSEIMVVYQDEYGNCAGNSPQQIIFRLTKQ